MAGERSCIPVFNSDRRGDNRVWTTEEDAKIIELRLLVGSNWARMSSMFDNHTALQHKIWRGNENEKKLARALSSANGGAPVKVISYYFAAGVALS
jgi:hypothetical protein